MSQVVNPPRAGRAECVPEVLGSERQFSAEFRHAGLAWVQYACIATATLLALFLAIPALSNEYTHTSAIIRSVMLAAALLLVMVVRRHSEVATRYYVPLVGATASLMLLGVAVLIAWPSLRAVSADFNPLPAMLLSLFLCYAFLRLPLLLVSIICWTFSLSVLVAAPAGFSGAGQLRLMLYLGAVNLLGMLLCRSTEVRERELYYQRRRLEQAQARLEERAQAAEEGEAEKIRLLAAVSHDLRQPMMAATTYLAVLRSKLLRSEVEQGCQQIDNINDSIAMLGATLDHLLTAARYDGGSEVIRIEMVELGPLLDRLHQTFESEAREKGIDLRVRVPAQRLVVTSDGTALWRVLMNLVSNAIKFTEALGRSGRGVLVRAFLKDGVCRIDVVDTGLGISEENQKAVWQPYFQVENAERNRARGLGLGLFLVRRALDHLPNHVLTLRSRLGRGSRFTIRLPGAWLRDPGVAEAECTPLPEQALEVLQGAYVLVLEDDRDARRAILELLDDWGVLHASGATFEELVQEVQSDGRSPDALITDFRLPGPLNGSQCVTELRRILDEHFPAVVVTGESDPGAIRKTLPADTLLLQKPFDVAALAAPLIEAVKRARRAESVGICSSEAKGAAGQAI